MGKQTWARNRRRPRVLQTPDRERESRTVTPDALRRGDLVRNILVLGKTGTGKTSLLNYLYGLDLPVGAGLPKTGKGIHESVFVRAGTAYHIFDSWGLEADSLPEWRQDVLALVGKRNTSPRMDEWFHAVYYCFSANTARIEDVEVDDIIVPLLRMGSKVLIILTNAEPGFRKEEKIRGMTEYLRQRLEQALPGAGDIPVLPSVSVAGETLGGDTVTRSGRSEILAAAAYSLADDIRRRLPAIYKANVRRKIEAWAERSRILAEMGRLSFWWNNNSAKELVDLINYDLLNTFGAIDADGNRLEAEAEKYLAAGGNEKLDKRWRPPFRRVTCVGGYHYSRGTVSTAVDLVAGLFRSGRSIRENLKERVDRTARLLLTSLDGGNG
ncbi:MAG: hypothetical protein MR631_02240 [Selenomonadales bacterium]|nr:hypothetical protein [Selenomonadales bacterium]